MKKFNKIIIFVIVIFLISSCYNKREELNPDSIQYCKNIKDRGIQQNCFIEYAQKIVDTKKDEVLIACNHINDSSLRDICLFKAFKVSSYHHPKFCEEIKDLPLRFKCVRMIQRPHLAKLIN